MSEFKNYAVTYTHEGKEWGLTICATSFEDAKARLARMPYARVDGELMMTVPASLGWWVPALVWLRNLLRPTNGDHK